MWADRDVSTWGISGHFGSMGTCLTKSPRRRPSPRRPTSEKRVMPLISRCSNSPGVSRSWRCTGGGGFRSRQRLRRVEHRIFLVLVHEESISFDYGHPKELGVSVGAAPFAFKGADFDFASGSVKRGLPARTYEMLPQYTHFSNSIV